jgi:ferric-chelate reductase
MLTKSIEHLQWVSDNLIAAIRNVPSDLEIKIHIHATSASTDTVSPETASKETPSIESSIEEKPSSVYLPGPDLPVAHGRPDIRNLLDNEIDSATGPVSVDGECL